MTRGIPHARTRAAGGGSESTAVETSMSEIWERKREEAVAKHISRQNASISRAITYLNAVPVISCCPLFDNNLRPPALPRDFSLRQRTKTETKRVGNYAPSTDYGCRLNNKLKWKQLYIYIYFFQYRLSFALANFLYTFVIFARETKGISTFDSLKYILSAFSKNRITRWFFYFNAIN